jgi:hypothetical protein
MLVEIILVSIATAFSFAVLEWKFSNGRELDALLDLACMVALSYIFGGSYTGMAIAMTASALISIYLIFNPFHIFFGDVLSFKVKYKTISKRITIGLAVAMVCATLIYVGVQYV